jgi:hypothetical protein
MQIWTTVVKECLNSAHRLTPFYAFGPGAPGLREPVAPLPARGRAKKFLGFDQFGKSLLCIWGVGVVSLGCLNPDYSRRA